MHGRTDLLDRLPFRWRDKAKAERDGRGFHHRLEQAGRVDAGRHQIHNGGVKLRLSQRRQPLSDIGDKFEAPLARRVPQTLADALRVFRRQGNKQNRSLPGISSGRRFRGRHNPLYVRNSITSSVRRTAHGTFRHHGQPKNGWPETRVKTGGVKSQPPFP